MITVITGPPCSGKSTYAREHARPGDITVDFDLIAQALGSPDSHDHPPELREITAAAWSAAVNRVLAYSRTSITAWIIDSKPTRQRWLAYQQARARHITLTASREELHRRADSDGRSPEWHRRIDAFTGTARDPAPVRRTQW